MASACRVGRHPPRRSAPGSPACPRSIGSSSGWAWSSLPETARPDLAVHLRSLVRKELVNPERSTLPGEDAYRFRHLLIRDAAYDAIPKGERARLHAAFADWLEAVAGDRIVEQEEIVGYHLERAYRYRAEQRAHRAGRARRDRLPAVGPQPS